MGRSGVILMRRFVRQDGLMRDDGVEVSVSPTRHLILDSTYEINPLAFDLSQARELKDAIDEAITALEGSRNLIVEP